MQSPWQYLHSVLMSWHNVLWSLMLNIIHHTHPHSLAACSAFVGNIWPPPQGNCPTPEFRKWCRRWQISEPWTMLKESHHPSPIHYKEHTLFVAFDAWSAEPHFNVMFTYLNIMYSIQDCGAKRQHGRVSCDCFVLFINGWCLISNALQRREALVDKLWWKWLDIPL